MFLKIVCVLISLNVFVLGFTATTVSVDSPVGQIHGLAQEHYTMFTGIPYGLVDENNPFGNAKPHPPFITPHPVSNDSTICPQYDKGVIKGNIQCLHLNVYKPNVIKQAHTLPVMVFIHGGAFVEGSGAFTTYSPRFLIRHDVIIVTVNYRLGPYGNLCFPNTEYSNQGLKDQNLALKWVKHNIASFGGDNDNILLFGHSAGSISAELHLLYSKEKIFNKVILQSGGAASSLCNQVTSMETFAKDVGLNSENINVIDNTYNTINVDRLIETISTIDTNTLINMTKLYDFRPCIDGELILRQTPKIKNIKLMVGGTTKETLFFYPTANQEEHFDLVTELKKGFSVSKMADSADVDLIKHFYADDLKFKIVEFTSDLAFNYPMERSVSYYVQNNCSVYRYLFSYDGNRNYMKIRDNISAEGSTHGDELGYLFFMPELESKFGNITEDDQVVIDRIGLLWTNFAKYGDPTPTPSNLLPVKWTPVTAGAKAYLQIDTNLSLHHGRPFEKRMAFWDLYYTKYGMYAKGISFGENFTERSMLNIGFTVVISGFVLLITVLLLWQ